MKKKIGAALSSAFIFPGVGQLILKRRCKGWFFILMELLLVLVFVIDLGRSLYSVVLTDFESGAIDATEPHIMDLLHYSFSFLEHHPDLVSLRSSVMLWMIFLFWLYAVVDCFLIRTPANDHGEGECKIPAVPILAAEGKTNDEQREQDQM